MSAVSGLNAKVEKGRSKYVALDINSIYKGKSLETAKTAVQPKHGLQSLGKVGAGRRMPPPANLPSLKSENSGNNPNVSLVPSGGQGWGSAPKTASATDKPEHPVAPEVPSSLQPSPPLQPASSLSQPPPKPNTTNTVPSSGANKTWSSVTSSHEDGGPERNFLGQQSPFFPQEFPKLAGGDVPTEGSQKSNVDTQYGPGPSLRPQTEGSWGRGTLHQPAGSGGAPPQSSGSGVNGPAAGPPPPEAQRPPFQPPLGPMPPPQFRGMMPSFMFGRNSYPTGYPPSNYSNVPPPQQNPRPQYPYGDNSRRVQAVRPLAEEEAYQRPAAIITEKALKGFDEILQNDTQDTWATSHGEIDYNAKLVFSDDEESPANVKKDKRESEDKPQKGHGKMDKDRKTERDRTISDRESRPLRDSDWNRMEKKSDPDADWGFEREGFERDRDERWKSWSSGPQGRTPGGLDMQQRQWQHPPPQRAPFDYRGPPPHSRMTGPPVMQHGNYSSTRVNTRPNQRSAADEDEMWRQRRKQHSEEMTMTVERARLRRAEEEKHYEQSKQSAQEKAKAFEKNDKEKELDIDDAERSRHSSESRDEKPSSRDGRDRDRDRSQPNYQGYNFSRQFQKNVPPRFQKQAAEYMRQQQGQQPPISVVPPGPHFTRSQTSPGAPPPMAPYDNAGWAHHPPYLGQISGMPSAMSKNIPRQRSNSQGSASDSYESDNCVAEPPAYEREVKENFWRDRRQPSVQGYDSWHTSANDNRSNRDSVKDERHSVDRGDIAVPPLDRDRDRKGMHSREDKKEKNTSLDWGDTPYPAEPKSREWHHHPPPITPKQFESIGPPKKNMTPLRRSNAPIGTVPEKKDSLKDEPLSKKSDQDPCIKKDKEEKNDKSKNENSSKDLDKSSDNKYESIHKSYIKDNLKKNDDGVEMTKKDNISDEKDKSKDKHEHSVQNRDRRRDTRERGERSSNPRSRGGGSFTSNNNVNAAGSGANGRFENIRAGRGGSNPRSGSYALSNTAMNAGPLPSGPPGTYRVKREYRRSKVERGPRFDRQKDKDRSKDDKKEKHSDDTSGSEGDEGKLGHLRQKDEDSEVSVDEASASTTESAQAEKYQGSEVVQDEDKNFSTGACKEISSKNERYRKEKKDNLKMEMKSYDKELKEEKGGFAPRGEPSRRGRGGSSNTLSFRNSRGGSRHGPSSYGPPPSRAGFGGNKSEKIEEQKIVEEVFNDDEGQEDFKNNNSMMDNMFPNRDPNKSRSLERSQQRRAGRYEQLPPRFQNKQNRRYEKFDQPMRGRGRGGRSGGFSGPGGQMIKMGQSGKENLSDVGNEEWETASESSDVADRRERMDDDDVRKKEMRDKASMGSRKSFSGQRPMNPDSSQGRGMNESRRGPGPFPADRNRQTFPRDTRSRESSGRGRSTNNGGGGERRMMNNNNNTNSRPPSSAGHTGNMSRNGGRGGNPPPKPGPFLPKNEGTAAVYRCDEIKLQDPSSVQAALTDLTNRRNIKAEVGIPKVSKSNKEKSGVLEGYDLNNYASVVVIDDHPEVGDETNLLLGTDDGFQEVTSKKRHKVMVENEVKKMRKEPHTRNKSGSRSRQSRLPPRFARQRESGTKLATDGTAWDINVDLSLKSHSISKDASPTPTMNAWEKPLLRSASPAATSPSVSSTAVACEVQVLAATSKSSSFDRSDQHDSGIDVSDQPASAASSQRSSPSNDCKILTPPGKEVSDLVSDIDTCKPMCTVVFENKNFKAENAVLDKFGGQNKSQTMKEMAVPSCETFPPVGSSINKSKESTPDTVDDKSHCLTAPYSTKESYGKNDENNSMKLDFTFESGLEQLTEDKNSISGKSLNIGRTMEVTGGTVSGVQSPISPSADDLNLKIQSVKKVWENDPPLPTVMEHPQSVPEEVTCPTSYGSFTSPSDSSNVYNGSVESVTPVRKESDVSDISFRESPSLQQGSKCMTVEHASVKMAMAPPTAPLSPPLMGGLDMRTMAGLASSVQVAGIPTAIPSPPTVLFNSSQQMAQTAGMYQPLQMDNRQTSATAVAAAMVQFSHSPQGYPTLGTYGLQHPQAPPSQQLGAYGQQSLFVQPPQQSQDMYSSNQYRVQPTYGPPQSQQMSSNQVLSAQQNMAGSHLLGSQLVQTRTTAGPSPAAPHMQGLHGLQPGPQTSYFSTTAQPQAANYYHQPPAATPGSPQYQNFGSQSVLQQAAPTPTFRNFGQFKAPGVMPERSATRSPTVDVSATNRSVFGGGTAPSTNLSSSASAAVAAGKMTNALPSSRMNAAANVAKTSQYSLQSQAQHYYPFGSQQKFGHMQPSNVRPPQVLFPNVVPRNPQQMPAAAAAATPNMHYPQPIQRPPASVQPAAVAAPPPQLQQKMGIRPTLPQQVNVINVPGGKLTSAQQAKLRAEAVQQTHMFFAQSGPGKLEKHDIGSDKTVQKPEEDRNKMADPGTSSGEPKEMAESTDAKKEE